MTKLTKVKLKVVSPHVEVRRAEADVTRISNEVEELREQLRQAERSLEVAEQRLKRVRQAKSSQNTGVDAAKELGYNTRRFEQNPTKRLAKRSLEVAQKASAWDPLSLVGLYLDRYAARYGRDWRGSQLGLSEIHFSMKRLYERVGDEAVEAITAVFSDKMKWVDGQIQLLLSVNAYERFVVPAMQRIREERRHHRSEQSEFPEALCSEEEGCVEVKL